MTNTEASITKGHLPTLIASFMHFDISFALWVLVGALGVFIGESLHLTPAAKGLMVAIPILSGAILRVPLGLLSDRVGGKRVGITMLVFLYLPLFLGWRFAADLPALLIMGLMLGTAGASFAVALPLASRWYPAKRQGLVMGVAAAGNSGTVIANLAAPRMANLVGWHNVFALAMIPLTVVLVAFVLMAKDNQSSTAGQPVASYLSSLKQGEMWWFCLFYTVTFGGYVGLSSFLPLFFRDQYHVSPATAGYITALAALVGSTVRPLGGYLSDRIGGVRILTAVLSGIALTYLLGSRLPGLGTMVPILLVSMTCLGMGNGAVFQLVPLRFPKQIGIATGVVGAIGGLGGFLLPALLGSAKQVSGSFSGAFIVLALIAGAALLSLRLVSSTGRHAARSMVPAEQVVGD
ncbi:MAG TPA: nitrate/nitrite transporter [Blastocatellia bacterium]|nr:nitrate/nitrite transporter [Blastocatellia bacterium]